tara:strand:- start:1858 stop:2628 length:771 start_codon:yes stop_codon:yes gene_type:complete
MKPNKNTQLCHYTDTSGCLGILNGFLWATECSFLNDSSEQNYALNKAIDIAHSYIKSRLDTAHSNPIDSFKHNSTLTNSFTTSFSRRQDDLRQWMSYCPNQTGYCIIFDEAEIRKAIKVPQADHIAELKNVNYANLDHLEDIGEVQNTILDANGYIEELKVDDSYDEEELQKFKHFVLDITTNALNIDNESPESKEDIPHFNDIIMRNHHKLASIGLEFKSLHFKEEEESRIIISSKKSNTSPIADQQTTNNKQQT